jgi:hypothetical protein
MIKKHYSDGGGSYNDSFDVREYQGQKTNINRFDYDLFDDKKNIVQDIFRVKRSATPKKGERWKIIKNDEVILEFNSERFTNKECEYLRSVDGVNWILKHCKSDFNSIKNISKLKIMLKKEMNK